MRLLRPFVLALLLIVACALPVLAQRAATQADLAAFEPIRAAINQVEAAVRRGGLSVNTLVEFAGRLSPIRDDLRGRIADLEPKLAQLDERIRQLGPAPGKDAAPEPDAIATERQRLAAAQREVDAALRQARFLMSRTDQVAGEITDRRRSVYTQELLEQTASVLSPVFWSEVVAALPDEVSSLAATLSGPFQDMRASRWLTLAAAVLIGAAMSACLIMLMRWWNSHAQTQPRLSRLSKALAGLGVLTRAALTTPIAVALVLQAVESFGFRTPGWDELAVALVVAVVVATAGRGVALALLAPDSPQRRLIVMSDNIARSLSAHLIAGVRFLGVMVFLLLLHRALAAPHSLTIATNMLLSLGIVALLLNLLLRTTAVQTPISETGEPQGNLGARAVLWLVTIGIALALMLGYAGLAAFLAERTVATIAVCGALYLAFAAVDALFTEAIAADTRRGRMLAHHLGVQPRQIGLVGTVLSGISFVLFVLVGLVLIVGPWQVSAIDFLESFKNLAFGVRIGEFNISLGTITTALLLLLLILFITRLVQRWLETQLLPRTDLEPSLQQSIAAIAGYVGVITAIVLTLAHIGIDLQKIALIAGALSVGIGFGLQAVVSNFVSGLILLAERPIRVGDLINVKGEEGRVLRISVRATEIDTGERSSVIVPNSELITGIVKNRTRGNPTAVSTIPIRVAFGTEPEQVRDILLSCAREHSRILSEPKPQTLFTGFGDSGLEFKLTFVIANVSDDAVVTSDLRFAILKRLREAGIKIPYPQRELRWHAPPAPKANRPSKPKRPRKRRGG